MKKTHRGPALLLHGGLLATLLSLSACGGDAAAPPGASSMSREAFITTYVELRSEAIRAEGHELGDDQRTAILARNGATEEELLGFAESHGADVEYMRGVWDEVEARLDAERVLPGTDERR